ncbi:MAG TPA: hypothetical protein VGE79_14420 [Niastella sp.]
MITIATSEIKEFLKRARPVKTYSILPILAYYRLDCVGDSATFTKTNNNAWVIHEIAADFESNISLLIDERLLQAMVSNSSSDTITITQDDVNITLSDGKSNVAFPVQSLVNYPAFPERDQTQGVTPLPAEMLYAIGAATSIIDQKLINQYCNCFINPVGHITDVFSTHNGHIMYRKWFNVTLPAMTISPEVGSIISGFESAQYYTANNYDFYECGKTTYGFIQSTYKCPNYSRPFASISNKDYFEVDRLQLIQFAELTVSSSVNTYQIITLEDNAMLGITFKHDDKEYQLHTKMEFEAEKTFSPQPFHVSGKLLITLLKAIDTKTVRWSPVNETTYCLWSTEDPDLLTLLLGTVI